MFEPMPHIPERFLLSEWISREVLPSSDFARAQKVLSELSLKIPEVSALLKTPQSPPNHAEGTTVEAHVLRVLSVLFFVAHNPSFIFSIEEFAREKIFELEWEELTRTIRERQDFLSVYAICHDLGKAECVKIDEEGRVHYPGHDRAGAGQGYAYAREKVLPYFGVGLSSAKLLSELIRYHMDIITTFTREASVPEYRAITALAGRAGVNTELFLSLVPACLFLDAVAGSLKEIDGRHSHDFTPLLHWFQAERDAAPERHLERELARGRSKKQAVKAAYAAAGLSPEEVFALLGTPIGPVRGEIMKKIDELVKDPDSVVDLGEKTEELRVRARRVNL